MLKKLEKNDKVLIVLLFLLQLSVAVAFGTYKISSVSAIFLEIIFFLSILGVGILFSGLKFDRVKKGFFSFIYSIGVMLSVVFMELVLAVIATGIDGRPADSFNLFDKPALYNLVNIAVIFVAMCLPSLAILFIYFDLKKSISKSQKQ